MSFVEVEANLLYILEEELCPQFQNRLVTFSKSTDPLYIIVQLKAFPLVSQPMIHDLKRIRVDKAIKKINNWVKIYFTRHRRLIIRVIDGQSQFSIPSLDFSEIDKLNVYRSRKESDQILSILKEYFDAERLNMRFYGK